MNSPPLVPANDRFTVTVEVVPPAGIDPEPMVRALGALSGSRFDGFSVATNPVAKPRMSALAACSLIQQRTGRPTILHCTTRDHNRLSLQGLLWGARALGIETVLVATGDYVALGDTARTTRVDDFDVFGLTRLAREAGLTTGVVLDTHPEVSGWKPALDRMKRKIDAGAQYAVTQPVYDRQDAEKLARATEAFDIPVLLGILPLRTARHAEFLHEKVAGIAVPAHVRDRMGRAGDPVSEGIEGARAMLMVARELFSGACIMPPFDHYEIIPDVLPEA